MNTPKIVRESSTGFFTFDIRDQMLLNREVECVGTIDAASVYSLCRQLRWLQEEEPESEITMYINSPGGEVDSGLALYDVMQGVSCPVRTVCLGTAASMAALLFASGSRREILPHGRVMIHDPLIPGGVGGSALHIQDISLNLLKTRESLGRILAERTGHSLEEIYARTAKDSWFDAQDAVDFGLADAVIDRI